MTVRATYVLPEGTYTDYKKEFDWDVVLTGTYTFNGNTAFYSSLGNIDIRNANITQNKNPGTSNTYIIFGVDKGWIDVGNVTATGCDVVFWANNQPTTTDARNAFDTRSVFTSNTATTTNTSPSVSGYKLWNYHFGVGLFGMDGQKLRRAIYHTGFTLQVLAATSGGAFSSDSMEDGLTVRILITSSVYRRFLQYDSVGGTSLLSAANLNTYALLKSYFGVTPTENITCSSIPMSRINRELSYSYNNSVNMNNTYVRLLAKKTSGEIKLSDTLSQTGGYFITPETFTITGSIPVWGYSQPLATGTMVRPTNNSTLYLPIIYTIYTTGAASRPAGDFTYLYFSDTNYYLYTYRGSIILTDVATSKSITLTYQSAGSPLYSIWQSANSFDGSNFFSNWTTSGTPRLVTMNQV